MSFEEHLGVPHQVHPGLLPTQEDCPEGVWVEVCVGTARSTQVLRGWREGVRWARGYPIDPWPPAVPGTRGTHLHRVLTEDTTYPPRKDPTA